MVPVTRATLICLPSHSANLLGTFLFAYFKIPPPKKEKTSFFYSQSSEIQFQRAGNTRGRDSCVSVVSFLPCLAPLT